MAHGAEHGNRGHESFSGGKGKLSRDFLELSPLFLFGSMLFAVADRKGVNKFVEDGTSILSTFFTGPVSGKGGGGHSAAKAHH